MNRREFMERLEKLLWNISDSEREEALQYYNNYFDDAGEENEAAVIKELVSPEQVAQKIKAGFSDSASEYSEQGYQDTRFQEHQEMISRQPRIHGGEPGTDNNRESRGGNQGTNAWKVLAIVLLCVVGAPIVIPVCIAVVAVIASLIIALAAVCFGVIVAGFAILFSGLAVIGTGIAGIFVRPAVGITVAGVGCLVFALGILICLFTLWCSIKIIPWLIRGIVGLVSYPFRKAGANK